MALISKNPFSNEEYVLPNTLNDGELIQAFLARNSGKPVVVVQGLGFVGAVMSLVCANAIGANYAVIGVDLLTPETYWRIRALNEGQFPLVADDPLISEFYSNAMTQGNFFATYDPMAYSFADVVIVDVNLDVQKSTGGQGELRDFAVDLSGFETAIRSIASCCKEDVLLLVETTVPPGTCQNVVKPIMDSEFQRRNLRTDHYSLGHSYERVMPGPEYINSIRSFPRVYSGIDDRSADKVKAFLTTIIDLSNCELRRLGSTNATEMAKVLENSYRAMNIAFVVEWSRFAEEAGVDLFEIVNAIRVRKTHANLMYPGIGVGGYCLTKDPLLASWSRRSMFGAEVGLDTSVKSVAINDQMPLFAYERLVRVCGNLKGQRVLVLGVSYRGDVGDTRFSPVKLFVDCLERAGTEVVLHDPYVTFWPERNSEVQQALSDALATEPDIVAICAGHRQYAADATVDALMNCRKLTVFDTLGLLSSEQITRLQTHHKVSILGRGDI